MKKFFLKKLLSDTYHTAFDFKIIDHQIFNIAVVRNDFARRRPLHIAIKMKFRQGVGILIIIMFDVIRLVHRLFRTPLNIKELQQILVVDVIFV